MTAPQHRYQSCRDGDCERIACVAWREARAEGYDEGYQDGYRAGAASAGSE